MKKTWIALLLVLALMFALGISVTATGHSSGAAGHCICGGADTDATCSHSDSLTWQAWDGKTITTSGNYYLDEDWGDDETIRQTVIGTSGSTTPITVNICLNGHNWTSASRIMLVWGNVTLNISNCNPTSGGTLTGVGIADNICGALLIQSGATVNMYDGVHVVGTGSNTLSRGGAVELSGTFHMYGGSITGRTVTGTGGAVQVNGAGRFYLHDGIINAGSATTGGAIRAESGAKIFMTGGTINGGNPTNKNATNGGCVFLESASMTMSGGIITGGKASNKGGAVILNGSSSMTMTGGLITGNTSTSTVNAGGVHVNTASSTFTVSGNAQVIGNTNASGSSNVYLITGKTVAIGEGGMGTTANIGITMQTPGQFAASTSTAGFFSDNGDYRVICENSDLYLRPFETVSHCICGDTNRTDNPCASAGHPDVAWIPLNGNTLPTTSGYYYLTKNINATAQAVIAAGNHVVIDLNGYNITQTTANTRLFRLSQASAQLTITDSVGSGQLIPQSDTSDNKFGMIVDITAPTATFNLYGGILNATGKTSKYGVAINNWEGTVYMYGGTITGGTSTTGGGGGNVMTYNGTFHMYGGTIENGTSQITLSDKGGGNITVGAAGALYIYGGTVRNGTSVTNGGNIRCLGTLTITGGTITGGTAGRLGNGIYMNGTSFTLSGDPVIAGNTDHDVYLTSGRYITIGNEGLSDGASIGMYLPAGEGTFTTTANATAANAAYFFSNVDEDAVASVGAKGLYFSGEGFRVGYAAVDITPDDSDIGVIGLMGYGTESYRKYMSRDAYSFVTTCLAVTDDEGDTILLFSVDSASISVSQCNYFKEAIAVATGIYPENIMIAAIHQHSTPLIQDNYKTLMAEKMVLAAETALADRGEAEMWKTSIEVVGEDGKNVVNFVRNYKLLDADGNQVGMWTPNHDDRDIVDYVSYDYESTADATMQLLKFTRAGQEDIIMANFQIHPHRGATYNSTVVTADLVGVFRDTLSSTLNCNVMYFSGASGNINPTSYITADNVTSNYVAQGQLLAQFAVTANTTYTQVATGDVAAMSQTVTYGTSTNEGLSEEAIAAATQIANGTVSYNAAVHKPLGIYSQYHANRIAERETWGTTTTRSMTISVYSLGDVAFVAAPCEMFDTNGDQIKNGIEGLSNPYSMTFVATLANGADGYIPSQLGFDNGGYSTDITRYAEGTGEALAEDFLIMLNTLKNAE